MAYCKHCGSKIVPGQKVCTQCGTRLVTETSSVPPFQNEPRKSRKIPVLVKILVAVLLVILVGAYFVAKHQLSPEKDVNHIVKALRDEDAKTLSKYLSTEKKQLTVEETKAYISLLKEDGNLVDISNDIEKAISEVNDGGKREASVSLRHGNFNRIFNVEKKGKKYLLFDNLEYTVPTNDINIKSSDEGEITYNLNGKEYHIKLEKDKTIELGYMPVGKYTLKATKKVNDRVHKGNLVINTNNEREVVTQDFNEKYVKVTDIKGPLINDFYIYVNGKKVGKYDRWTNYGPFVYGENENIYATMKIKGKTYKSNVVNIDDLRGDEDQYGIIDTKLKFDEKDIDDYKKEKEND
ncbi:hypothetical protein SPETJ133_04160 [Staphylococcus petrasii]